jgi:glycosyltransferase involved in cell wall biosynthesis
MRILFLSPRQCWPATGGAKLREYHFLRALGQKASVTYVHFAEPGAASPTVADLPFCREIVSVTKPRPYTPAKILRGMTGRWPLPVLNYSSREMAAALSRVAGKERFDLIHLDSIHMAGYADGLARASGGVPQIIYNWHNIESEAMRRHSAVTKSPARSLYAGITARQLERVERAMLGAAFGHVVCSEREQQQLLKIAPNARIAVVYNGVDIAYFADEAENAAKTRILFVGLMNYYPNVEAALRFTHDVWPRLRERLPGSRLTLVGATPAPAVLALGDIAGVEVTGTVPDVRPYYAEAAVAIVPLRSGGGTRLKILEAMAAGVPVVSTPLGAEGLCIEPSRNILLAGADDTDAWVREISGLTESESRRQSLTASAMQLVRERYDWTILGKQLVETYTDWLEKAG